MVCRYGDEIFVDEIKKMNKRPMFHIQEGFDIYGEPLERSDEEAIKDMLGDSEMFSPYDFDKCDVRPEKQINERKRKISPFDGDFDATKRSEYERLIVSLADNGMPWILNIEDDEEIAIYPTNSDHSKMAVELKTPKYFEDKDTGEIFIDEISTDTYETSLPPGWTAREIQELFDGYAVYFRASREKCG